MLRPSLMSLWMRPAKMVGSGRLKPEVSREVSKRSQTRSFTVWSCSFSEKRLRSSLTIEWSGLSSRVFLETMKLVIELSRRAWAFMIRSMLADQPNSPVTRQHGELARRSERTTFSTLSPRISFIFLQRSSKAAFSSSFFFFSSSVISSVRLSLVTQMSFLSSYSLSCWTAYSSMGSTMYRTSYPFFLSFSRKGDCSTTFLLSPVM
mmetsp:Transcript_17327/g.31096  ORF Transcript_17327/g.31096 Transcript_17327/m.31096 type:complete len:206 (+) Transcript_17327:254-871(+)